MSINKNCLALILLAHAGASAATITSPLMVTGLIGKPLNYQITADNNPQTFGAQPSIPGLSLDTKTGLITGAPTTTGTFRVTVTARPTRGMSALAIVEFLIAAPPLTFLNPSSAIGTVGTAFGFEITPSTTDANFLYRSSGLPPGLFIDGDTGVISGTPTTPGEYAPIITVSSSSLSGSEQLMLTISGGSSAPSAVAITPVVGTVGAPFSGAFSAQGTPPIAFSISSGLPPGLVTSNGNSIFGTPTAAGLFPVVVTATNAFGSASAALTLAIADPNGAPLISTPLTINATVGDAVTYTFQAAGMTPISFKLDSSKLPQGLVVNNTGTISGSPFAPGIYTVPVSATNERGTDLEILTLNIASLPQGNAQASVKFSETYSSNGRSGLRDNFRFTAELDAPGFNSGLLTSADITVTLGLFSFDSAANRFGPRKKITGKLVVYSLTGGALAVAFKNGQLKFSGLCRTTIKPVSILATQLAGLNQPVGEAIPVKITVGDNIIAAFYMMCSGIATSKGPNRNSVRLKSFPSL